MSTMLPEKWPLPPLPALLWPVAMTSEPIKSKMEEKMSALAASRGIAVPAITADAGHLKQPD